MADSSDAVLAAVWSVLLDFFADGVSFVFMVGGLLLMSGVDMRAVRGMVVECFSAGCASKCTFGSSLLVGFQVVIESRFV